jgi:hypothetical protein
MDEQIKQTKKKGETKFMTITTILSNLRIYEVRAAKVVGNVMRGIDMDATMDQI